VLFSVPHTHLQPPRHCVRHLLYIVTLLRTKSVLCFAPSVSLSLSVCPFLDLLCTRVSALTDRRIHIIHVFARGGPFCRRRYYYRPKRNCPFPIYHGDKDPFGQNSRIYVQYTRNIRIYPYTGPPVSTITIDEYRRRRSTATGGWLRPRMEFPNEFFFFFGRNNRSDFQCESCHPSRSRVGHEFSNGRLLETKF